MTEAAAQTHRAPAHDKAVVALALLIAVLLTLHLSQDVVFGMEPGDVSEFIAAAIAGVWLYFTLAFSGRRLGCALLLLASFLSPIVALAHMAGDGVGEDIDTSGGAILFVWTMLAIGVTAPVSLLFALQGLWRLKQSVMDFILWSALPILGGGALLGYVVSELF